MSRGIEGSQTRAKGVNISTVPAGRNRYFIRNPARSAGLLSFCPSGTIPRLLLSRRRTEQKKPPMLTQSQPCDRPANRDPWFPAQIASR